MSSSHWKEAFSKRGELLRGKMKLELELKKRIVKTLILSTVLYAVWTLRKVHDIQRWNRLKCGFGEVNENQLNWPPIQSRGFGHGGWKQKLDEHHPTKTEKLIRSCVEKWIPTAYTVLESRMEGTRIRGTGRVHAIRW